MKIRINLMVGFLSVILFSGCLQKQSITNEHIVEFVEAKQNANTKNKKTIKLKVSNQNNFYSTTKMWYKNKHEFSYFANNKWAMSPSNMVYKTIKQSFINSSNDIVDGYSTAKTNYLCEIEVIDFYQDFTNGSNVVMTVQINLISQTTNILVGTKTFHYSQKTEIANSKSGVFGYSEILKRMSSDIQVWIDNLNFIS